MAQLGDDIFYDYKPGRKDFSPIILLHGTGGDEKDLRSIGENLFPDSPLIGIRGRVQENGQNRYFKRTVDGHFDQQDLIVGEKWLLNALIQIMRHLELPLATPIVVGYSNGANIAADLLLRGGPVFHAAVLFHPMPVSDPLPERPEEPLKGVPIFATYGRDDSIVSEDEFKALTKALNTQGATVVEHTSDNGHSLSLAEIEGAQNWLSHFQQPTEEKKA